MSTRAARKRANGIARTDMTYTIPGIVIDLCSGVMKERDTLYFVLTCILSNTVCALFSNLLVFHLQGIALLLWLLMGALSGIAGGAIAGMVYRRLSAAVMQEGRGVS